MRMVRSSVLAEASVLPSCEMEKTSPAYGLGGQRDLNQFLFGGDVPDARLGVLGDGEESLAVGEGVDTGHGGAVAEVPGAQAQACPVGQRVGGLGRLLVVARRRRGQRSRRRQQDGEGKEDEQSSAERRHGYPPDRRRKTVRRDAVILPTGAGGRQKFSGGKPRGYNTLGFSFSPSGEAFRPCL